MAMTREELDAEIRDVNARGEAESTLRTIDITGHEMLLYLRVQHKDGPHALAACLLERLRERFGDDLNEELPENAIDWDGDPEYPFDGGLYAIGVGGTPRLWFILANVNDDQTFTDLGGGRERWNGWVSGYHLVPFKSEHAARLAFAGFRSVNSAWRLSNGYIGSGMFEGDEDDEDDEDNAAA